MRYTNLNYRFFSYAIIAICIGSLIFNVVLSIYISEQNEKISELYKEAAKQESRLTLDEIKRKAESRKLALDELYKRIEFDKKSDKQ